MILRGWITFLLFAGLVPALAQANNVAGQDRIAVALLNLRLYQDSSFIKPTEINYREGETFNVLAETVREHLDNSQDQKFKWFYVSSRDGNKGWIFGDAIAVILSDDKVSEAFKPYHKQAYHFNNGFESAVLWFGQIEGHDNFSEIEVRNPLYREVYLVITAERGFSAAVPISSLSTQGSSEIERLIIEDVTGDSIPELLLEFVSRNVGSPIKQVKFEIHAFISGSLVRVFEEQMNMQWTDTKAAPIPTRAIDIESNLIRTAWIDYGDDLDTAAHIEKRAITYKTYTHHWVEGKKSYKPLYALSEVPITGRIKSPTPLFDSHLPIGQFLGLLAVTTDFVVQAISERTFEYNQKMVTEILLLIKTTDDRQGWISGSQVDIAAGEFSLPLISHLKGNTLPADAYLDALTVKGAE
jgi:hypothetical protein